MDSVPRALGVVPEGVEVLDVARLLLDPGVVLEVVDALAVLVRQLHHAVGLQAEHVQVVVKAGFLFAVGAVLLVELLNAAAVHHSGVGQNGADDIVLGQLIVLGHLDAAQDVCDAGDAEPGELFDELVGELELFFEVLLALCRVEKAQQTLGILVVDGDGHVSVLHVVDPGDVLVADALNAVAAEAVIQDRRALERFAHAELHAWITLLEEVARAHRTGGTGGEARARETLAGLLHGLEEVCKGVARDIVVPQRVAHLFKLVEDHHAGVLLELPGLVENLLDVGLAARRCDDLTGDQDGDDGLDNEIITVDLNRVDPNVNSIVFFLNIYNNNEYSGDFSGIPYASIRMFEGTPERPPKQVFAQYDVATKTECVGKRALIMGKLYRRNGEWKFAAIGDAFEDRGIAMTIVRVARDYSK